MKFENIIASRRSKGGLMLAQGTYWIKDQVLMRNEKPIANLLFNRNSVTGFSYWFAQSFDGDLHDSEPAGRFSGPLPAALTFVHFHQVGRGDVSWK